jgi:adenylate kinase
VRLLIFGPQGAGKGIQRGREDDTEEVIARRLAIYYESTEPLLRFYGPPVRTIDGNRPVPLVHQEIIAAVTNVTASV